MIAAEKECNEDPEYLAAVARGNAEYEIYKARKAAEAQAWADGAPARAAKRAARAAKKAAEAESGAAPEAPDKTAKEIEDEEWAAVLAVPDTVPQQRVKATASTATTARITKAARKEIVSVYKQAMRAAGHDAPSAFDMDEFLADGDDE